MDDMNTLERILLAAAVGIAGALASALPVQAQQPATPAASTTAQAGDMADAEVRKVDREKKQVTLKHGTIKSLDMPPMTMVFQVKDAAMLDKLQPGDRIRFRAARIGGRFTVTEMEPAK